MSFKSLILTSLALSFCAHVSALADGIRPADFADAKGNKAVFVDFKNADHLIQFDVVNKTAKFISVISFVASSAGAPIFDMVGEPSAVELDGKTVDQILVDSPDQTTKFRVVARNVSTGKHILKVAGEIKLNVEFEADGVKSGFWMTDLKDRGYLEQYLPSNLDYDQFSMNMEVRVLGTQRPHVLITNGTALRQTQKNLFGVHYPETFSTFAPFFHLVPEDSIESTGKNVSLQGREIRVNVYKKKESTEKLDVYLAGAVAALKDLEKTYGPYLHPNLVVYAAGTGGMEYAGATITSLEALSHEVAHSWFGRGVIPAGGNAGWLDEAITSWRDMNFPKTASLSGNEPMADHGPYNRTTDTAAYGFGAEFIGLLNSSVPNFFDFMKHLYKTRSWSPITTENFAQELSTFTGKDFAPVFKKYVYRPAGGNRPLNRRRPIEPNRYHPQLSKEELRRLL